MKYVQLLNPFILSNSIEIPITENDRQLMSLKNIHKGKRAFIIGMGSILRISDLEKLKGEITFACNKILKTNAWQ